MANTAGSGCLHLIVAGCQQSVPTPHQQTHMDEQFPSICPAFLFLISLLLFCFTFTAQMSSKFPINILLCNQAPSRYLITMKHKNIYPSVLFHPSITSACVDCGRKQDYQEGTHGCTGWTCKFYYMQKDPSQGFKPRTFSLQGNNPTNSSSVKPLFIPVFYLEQ